MKDDDMQGVQDDDEGGVQDDGDGDAQGDGVQDEVQGDEAKLVRNYDRVTLLTGVKCRATSVAKKLWRKISVVRRNLILDTKIVFVVENLYFLVKKLTILNGEIFSNVWLQVWFMNISSWSWRHPASLDASSTSSRIDH